MANGNDYEQAFESWLAENGIKYLAVDQARRSILTRNRVKTFDFLLYPACRSGSSAELSGTEPQGVIIAEVKGRQFRGATLCGRPPLQCWVTAEDIQGLLEWERRFDEPLQAAKAVLIFAYRFEMPSVETDGREIYEFADHRYMFYALAVDDYCRNMKTRSRRWGTVMLGAADFRRLAIDVRLLLTGATREVSHA